MSGLPIDSIRSYDSHLQSSRLNLTFMTVPPAAACIALLTMLLHFVSYKLKKAAEKKSFHV
jgi:hypothetical protein